MNWNDRTKNEARSHLAIPETKRIHFLLLLVELPQAYYLSLPSPLFLLSCKVVTYSHYTSERPRYLSVSALHRMQANAIKGS